MQPTSPRSSTEQRAAVRAPRRTRAAPAREPVPEPAVMSAEEVLERLTQIARGDLGDFLTSGAGAVPAVDLERAAARGKLRLLKRLKAADCSIELHDAYAALVQLGRHYRLFAEGATALKGSQPGPPILELLFEAEQNGDIDKRFTETARLLEQLSLDLESEP